MKAIFFVFLSAVFLFSAVNAKETKKGPAVPPVKTPEGWLVFFHGAFLPEERESLGWKNWCCGNCKVYSAGVMLLEPIMKVELTTPDEREKALKETMVRVKASDSILFLTSAR